MNDSVVFNPCNLQPSTSFFDVLLITTNNPDQEAYWQERLIEMQGVVTHPKSLIIAVSEDWPGGAGNGLGTLYALLKARKKGQDLYGVDIFAKQKEGASIALYHTAGQGIRLFPLTPCEQNNKSAVKLPGKIGSDLLTILEATILQTSVYAASRPGRLSVFWGDQLFIPSKNLNYTPTHHVDILAKMGPAPTKMEWNERGLNKYGLIALDNNGSAQQIEKCGYQEFQALVSNGKISIDGGVGISLGSFSLSTPMTFALLREFERELQQKAQKLDSDAHFWMPTTLGPNTYLSMMQNRGTAQKHYERMQKFKERFCHLHSDDSYFGVVDVGRGSYWWDFGSTDNYFLNLLKLTSPTKEGELMRLFFSITPERENRIVQDEHSILVNCKINSGRIKNSILLGVEADAIEVSNCVLINSRFNRIKAESTLLYGVHDDMAVSFDPGTIRADVKLPSESLSLYTTLGRDSKKDWESVLPGNLVSYREVYDRVRGKR